MYAAFAVGLTIALGKFLDWWFFTMLSRPVFLISILGALLGNPVEGIILGASMELIFLGTTSIGGVVPQDIIIGSVFASALALVYGQETSVAVALSVPLSLLGSIFWNFFKSLITLLAERFEKLIADKNIKGFKRLWIFQYISFLVCYFLLGFIGFLLGADAINSLIQYIPKWITSSLTVAAGMLPALGMALLMTTLWDKTLAPYFFIGFSLITFFGGNLISVAFIGCALAAIIAFNDLSSNKQEKAKVVSGIEVNMDEEDFFND